MNISHKQVFLASLLSLFLIPTVPLAIQVEVPDPYFQTEGLGKSKTFFVTNDSTKHTAVSVQATTRVNDINGKESRESAEKAFEIFPNGISL